MKKEDYITKIVDINEHDLADAVLQRIVTFKELQDTGNFDRSKQKAVKQIIQNKDDEVFSQAQTFLNDNNDSLDDCIQRFEDYVNAFRDFKSCHMSEAQSKIQQLRDKKAEIEQNKRDRNRVWQEIIDNPNSVTPDELYEKGITADDIRQMHIDGITDDIIDAVYRYQQPRLVHNNIPQSLDEIPSGYTDVFFWGIPSSGKTCALASIIDTMKNEYTIADPDIKIKFGATYRHSLDLIFNDSTGIGNLPDRTVEDRTQYMPFLFKTKKEKKYRKIAFFELSGEVFKHFYDITYSTDSGTNESQQDKVRIGFDTLQLLLNSNNQKIHFFFIDYDYQTQTHRQIGWSQAQYLEAAATYFRDTNDIFKKKTDAVYVVITKSDEIRGDEKAREKIAKEFLEKNFGSFMNVIKTRCEKDSIFFDVKMFSIGRVWFKRICKIDRRYANEIINELLEAVKPQSESKIKNILNS